MKLLSLYFGIVLCNALPDAQSRSNTHIKNDTVLWRPLYEVVSNGNENDVQQLIDNGANVNLKDKNALTPLTIAASNGREKMIEVLLKNGANVNLTNEDGRTALHCAAENGKGKTIEILIRFGANVHQVDNQKLTPLHLAAWKGHIASTEVLIRNGANVNQASYDNWTPLHYATYWTGSKSVVDLLIKYGADVNFVNSDGDTPLHFAAMNGFYDCVELLINNGANIMLEDKLGSTALDNAFAYGKGDVIELLIRNGANSTSIDESGRTLLHFTAIYGLENAADFAIKYGAKLDVYDKDGQTPLQYAAKYGRDKVADLLIRNGATISSRDHFGRTALHWAAKFGSEAIADMLIENGANIRFRDSEGVSPLHMSAVYDQMNISKLLIENGADINAGEMHAKTALHMAASLGRENIADLLIRNGANISSIDSTGQTALHMAAFYGYDRIVKMLIENGAVADCVNEKDGQTPLHLAVENGHLSSCKTLYKCNQINRKVIEVLLKNNANPNIKDFNGKSPIDIAIDKGFTEIVDFIRMLTRPAHKACELYSQNQSSQLLGENLATSGEFLWMVALGYWNQSNLHSKLSFECVGSIISEYFILTAAHCARSDHPPALIRPGKMNRKHFAMEFQVNETIVQVNNIQAAKTGAIPDYHILEIIRHPEYSFQNNDIALIRVTEPIQFKDSIRPACLRLNVQDVHWNEQLRVSALSRLSEHGWYSIDWDFEFNQFTVPLALRNQEAQTSECITMIENIHIESLYCADGGTNNCDSDSGGILQSFSHDSNMAHIVGIFSFGCDSSTYAYAKVAYYLDWIESHVWPIMAQADPASNSDNLTNDVKH